MYIYIYVYKEHMCIWRKGRGNNTYTSTAPGSWQQEIRYTAKNGWHNVNAVWCSACPGVSDQPIELFKTGRARSSWQQDILETDSCQDYCHDVNAVWGSACCNVAARLTHAWSGALGVRACRVISCHVIVKGAKSLRLPWQQDIL